MENGPPYTPVFRAPQVAGWVALAGGVFIVIGSLIPWVTLVFGISVTALEGDGLITLLIGVLIAVCGVVAGMGVVPNGMNFVASVLALVAAGVAGWNIVQIRDLLRNESSSGQLDVVGQLGPGLPVIALGAVVVVVATTIGGLARPRE